MAKILISGAGGFVGSHLLEDLKQTDHEILALTRRETNLIDGVRYFKVDLRNTRRTEDLIKSFAPEVVYHLAANSKESTGEHSPIDMTTNGYNTFFNVLSASIKAGSLKKFIYTSSAAVYGNIRTPYKENQIPEPNDIYAVTKYANELSLKIMANYHKFDYVILRPHNITGERQDPTDPTRNVVTMFMQLLRLGRAPKIFGDGSSTRCYTYVKDVTKILKDCLNVKNVTINVGSDKPTTIKQLYDKIVEISGIKIDPEYLPNRGQDVTINTVDHTHARRLFKQLPEMGFDETIRKTWAYVSSQPLKDFKKVKKEIEL